MKKIITILCVLIFGAVAFFSIASAKHPCLFGKSCDHIIERGLSGYLTTNPDPVKSAYSAQGMAGPVQWEEIGPWIEDGFNVTNPDNYIPIPNLRAIITSIPLYYVFPQLDFTQILPKELEELIQGTKKTVSAKKGPINLTGYVAKNGGPITFKVELTARVFEKRRLVRKIVKTGFFSINKIDTGIPHVAIVGVVPSDNTIRPMSPITGKSGICAKNTPYYDPQNPLFLTWRNDVEPVAVNVLLNSLDDHEPNNSGIVAIKFEGDTYQYSNKTWMPFIKGWKEILLTPGPGFKIIKVIAADNALNYSAGTLGNKLLGHVSDGDGEEVVEVLDCPSEIYPPAPLPKRLPTSINQNTVNGDATGGFPVPMYIPKLIDQNTIDISGGEGGYE